MLPKSENNRKFINEQVEMRLRNHIPRNDYVTRVKATLVGKEGLFFFPKWNPTMAIDILSDQVLRAMNSLGYNKQWFVTQIEKQDMGVLFYLRSNKNDKCKVFVQF